MRNKKHDKTYFIDDEKPEFNMMAYYMMRMDQRSDERDTALNTGDLAMFYRSTMTLLMNSIPRFKQKGMESDAVTKLKADLMEIGGLIKNMSMASENVRDRNKMKYEEKLFEYNIRLNEEMFKYGLIYPTKDIKPLGEVIEADF